ncbi:hypothetical protein BC826DRAFT_260600 [Russula brevipes]|nr:hypothetical protein BC826DRAFT_260600 [Russula brevipes]
MGGLMVPTQCTSIICVCLTSRPCSLAVVLCQSNVPRCRLSRNLYLSDTVTEISDLQRASQFGDRGQAPRFQVVPLL